MSRDYNKDISFFVDAYFKQKPMYKDFFIEFWIQCMTDGNWSAVPMEVRLGIINVVLDYHSISFNFVYNVFFIGLMDNKSEAEKELWQEDLDKGKRALSIMPDGLKDTFLWR